MAWLARGEDDYAQQLGALLPPGRAWPRDPGSTLGRLLAGLAREFARIDGRALALLDEADPNTALELLPDWERVAGLPDPCRPIAESVRERRIAIGAKIAGIGGQTPAFLIELARSAGYDVEIEEFSVFTASSSAGDDCNDDDWKHVFSVNVWDTVDILVFVAGSNAGERLRSWGSLDLECLINRARPAHSIALFTYILDPEPALWVDFTAI